MQTNHPAPILPGALYSARAKSLRAAGGLADPESYDVLASPAPTGPVWTPFSRCRDELPLCACCGHLTDELADGRLGEEALCAQCADRAVGEWEAPHVRLARLVVLPALRMAAEMAVRS